MKLDRRTLLMSLALLLAYPFRAFAQTRDELAASAGPVSRREVLADAAFEKAFAELEQKAVDFHRKLGYRRVPSAPLVTGHQFNGGLRHDTHEALSNEADRVFVVQDIARIGDIDERERHDILPYFHIIYCNWSGGKTRVEAIDEALDFLIQSVGIAPNRLAIVSVDVLSPHRQQLASHGIDWQRQVVIRDEEEAKLAGDGSGYFAPDGHPEQYSVPCIGIYAWLGDDSPAPVETYPLAGQWTEVGEIDFDPQQPIAQGFGLERLVYATSGLFPSWHDRREHLLARLDAEISTEEFPEGYRLFNDG